MDGMLNSGGTHRLYQVGKYGSVIVGATVGTSISAVTSAVATKAPSLSSNKEQFIGMVKALTDVNIDVVGNIVNAKKLELKAGLAIYGNFSKVTVRTGTVICYWDKNLGV
jgi:hypothetical protein